MPTVKEWIVIVALVALVLIPICWKFWKRWDRPSLASLLEMKRRIRERDIREAFIKEDAKVREQQRIEAERELAIRKAQAPPPVEKEVLTTIVAPVENVDSLVDQLDVEGIAENVIPEAAPVAVQLRAETNADDVKWDGQQEDDDWSDIGWS